MDGDEELEANRKSRVGALGQEATVLWNEAALASLGISRDVVKKELEAMAGQRAEMVA